MKEHKNSSSGRLSTRRSTFLTPAEAMDLIEIPTDETMGDYAFPCFKLAKELLKSSPMIAKDGGQAGVDTPSPRWKQSRSCQPLS